jgi:methylated-DNA-[protein]-cysteine S-methyltransferase
MTIHSTVLDTPIGPLTLLARDGVLLASGFSADPTALHDRLHSSLRADDLMPTADLDELGDLGHAHRAYFAGDLGALDDLPLHQPGSASLEALWTVMREIKAGETLTYGQLAERAGIVRGARVAGAACARNLIAPAIPCHRVVASAPSGVKRLNGYLYGLDRKDWLLKHEGARTISD